MFPFFKGFVSLLEFKVEMFYKVNLKVLQSWENSHPLKHSYENV